MNVGCVPSRVPRLGSRALRLLFAVAALGSMAALGSSARAESESTLADCVSRVVNAARTQRAKPSGPPVVDFMLTGDERSYEYALPEDGCLGFLAVGHRQVQHLGLSLFAPSGRLLAQDEGRDAHAYARFCGEGGRRFVVDVHMIDGQGEFQLVPLWNAPAALEALEPIMASCMSTGTARPDPVDVGPEPAGPPIDVELLSVTRQLESLGYRLEGSVLSGGLPERRREVRRLMLDGGQCYALAAIGDGDVEDIDMRLLSIADNASLVASDVTRRRDAVLKVCPEHAGVYVLDVRMYRGAGNYVVQSFGLAEPHAPPPAGIEGSTRIPYAELLAQLERRGMHVAPVVWGLLQPEGTQSIPLKVRAGRCYAVGAVASGDFAGGDLDMSLTDESGRLLSADIGPNANPLLYHCAAHDGVLRAVLQGREVRRPARFLLAIGDDAPSEPAP
jgi:hypothetical protein